LRVCRLREGDGRRLGESRRIDDEACNDTAFDLRRSQLGRIRRRGIPSLGHHGFLNLIGLVDAVARASEPAWFPLAELRVSPIDTALIGR